jgi:hypothetical protein
MKLAMLGILPMLLGIGCANDSSFSAGSESELQSVGYESGHDKSDTYEVEIPANAVTQGSFTVWTVPSDPVPNQEYKIVIDVEVPDSSNGYQWSDLTGTIVGTDGFRMTLSKKYSGKNGPVRYTQHKGMPRLIVDIPGASKRVRDTIKVNSKVLDENQTIHIEF